MVTVKIPYATRTMVKMVAAQSGRTMHQVITELVRAEAKRLKVKPAATNGTPTGRKEKR